jgi:hypoxanthine phosphoribosyltransferase
MSDLRQEAVRVLETADRLYDENAVDAAFQCMAEDINRDMVGSDALVICVMNGGLVASGMLLPRLDFPLLVDYMHASRYRERTSGDDLHWKVDPSQPLAGRDLLIIDDILDEGFTLDAIIRFCRQQAPASVRAAVLIRKEHERGVRPPVDYVGLTVPDRYVFGYGMDYKGYWRNAPGIFAVAG